MLSNLANSSHQVNTPKFANMKKTDDEIHTLKCKLQYNG